MCSCHVKQLKLDGRPEIPIYQNEAIPGVPHLIRGNRLTGLEFRHFQWQDELDFFAYDGVSIMQSYIFLQKYQEGQPLPPEKLAELAGKMDFTVIGEIRSGTPGVCDPGGNNLLTGKPGYEHGKY